MDIVEWHESGVICIKQLNPNCRCPFCNKLREDVKEKREANEKSLDDKHSKSENTL